MTATTHVEVLTEAECRRLLAEHDVGRVAFVDDDWPVVLPVNYVIDNDVIAIRTDAGSEPLFHGVVAIFGHGNVAGLGEALASMRERLPTLRAHTEQAMALAAIAFAQASRRRRLMACTTSGERKAS